MLVGVTFPGVHRRRHRGQPRRARRCWSTPPAPTRSAAWCSAATTPDHTWFIGKGKADELRELCLAVDADTVVFDNELTPGPAVQPREAARPHRHRPHRGDPRHLRPERPHPGGQGAGRAGAAALPPAAAAPRRQRQAVPAARRRRHPLRLAARPSSRSTAGASCAASPSSRPSSSELAAHRASCSARAAAAAAWPAVTIVGYTNAGKSTLLNRLTDAGVLVEDRLFATLDPTTRRLALPGGEPVLLTDTVGFVRTLPHGLVEAFKSTLEVAGRRRLARPRRRRQRRRPRGPDRRRARGAGRDRRRPTCPSCWCSTRPTSRRRRGQAAASPTTRARSPISAVTGEGIDELAARARRPAAALDARSSSC